MYCTNCGQALPDTAGICPNCGQPVQRFSTAPAVPNYLVQSILVTVCCCMPFGVVAIVYSSNVNSRIAVGDVAGAQEAARKAKMWAWIAFAAGLLIAALYFVGAIASVLTES